MIGHRPPRYDLRAAQQTDLEISESCIRRAGQSLIRDRPIEVERYMRSLFRTLTPADFAHVEVIRPRAGRVIRGDVYGKRNSDILWFIKFRVTGSTILMSCHEAEHDLTLADGRVLRR